MYPTPTVDQLVKELKSLPYGHGLRLDSYGLPGYWASLELHRDDSCGPPWEEQELLGTVTEVNPPHVGHYQDTKHAAYFNVGRTWYMYDKDAATQAALEAIGKLHLPAKALKAKLAAMVNHELEYIQGWCNNDWTWLYYCVAVRCEEEDCYSANVVWYDSCGGFDDRDYAVHTAAAALLEWITDATHDSNAIAA